MKHLIFLLALLFFMGACSQNNTPPTKTPVSIELSTNIPPVTSSAPTETPAPTHTAVLLPTNTPSPTSTPQPPTVTWLSNITVDDSLDAPDGLAIDPDGNLYVLDAQNQRVLKFNSQGELLLQWGEPGRGNGQFNSLGWGGLAVDPDGQFVYVVDNGNYRVQKFDSQGNFLLAFGHRGTDEGEFERPIYIVTDDQGNVYTTDDGNPWVQKFDSAGNFITRWGGRGSGDGQFSHVTGITIDPQGNLFVADFEGNRIQKFDANGQFLLAWGGVEGSEPGQLRGPNALATDAQGRVYEVDRMNQRVQVFDNQGHFLVTWGNYGSQDGQFQFPSGIAVAENGRIYVGDERNDRIQVFQIDWFDGATESVTPQAVTFATTDGVILQGTLYGGGKTAVIFSTMGEHHQETWAEMAQTVAAQGYLALTYDFRFWRDNGTVDGTLRDRAADDLLAAIAFVEQQGAQHVVLVGASLGGLASLKVADETEPAAVIILAAPFDADFFPSLRVTAEDVQAITAPVLFIVSQQDDFAAGIQQMYELAAEPKELHLYSGNAHGTELFNTPHAADLTERILTFIQTHISAVSTLSSPTSQTTTFLSTPGALSSNSTLSLQVRVDSPPDGVSSGSDTWLIISICCPILSLTRSTCSSRKSI